MYSESLHNIVMLSALERVVGGDLLGYGKVYVLPKGMIFQIILQVLLPAGCKSEKHQS